MVTVGRQVGQGLMAAPEKLRAKRRGRAQHWGRAPVVRSRARRAYRTVRTARFHLEMPKPAKVSIVLVVRSAVRLPLLFPSVLSEFSRHFSSRGCRERFCREEDQRHPKEQGCPTEQEQKQLFSGQEQSARCGYGTSCPKQKQNPERRQNRTLKGQISSDQASKEPCHPSG